MSRLVVSIDDLSDTEIARILARAAEFERGKTPRNEQSRIVGLLFQQTSLRTRVGFAAAAARLGWQSIEVSERRHDPSSMIESWEDTLRTLSGYLDVLVARPGEHLSRDLLETSLNIPYISGGSVPPDAEHPSQALIDLYAMEAELGSVTDLSIAICGDMRMRAVRSLLRLLARRIPRRMTLITVPTLAGHSPIEKQLESITEHRTLTELDGIDVLYVAGIPHQAIPEDVRDTLRVTAQTLVSLPCNAIVLSPLPIIDEIDEEARSDSRIRMFEQSDRALFVRMALLEHVGTQT